MNRKKIGIFVFLLFVGVSILPTISGLILDMNISKYSKSNNINIKTAIILHPFEWQAQEIAGDMPIISEAIDASIISCFLENAGYNVIYKENEEVDLNFIKNNLSADLIFNFGHGKFADIDGDFKRDMVTISTGERWTDETPEKYSFEFANGWIMEGLVGGKNFIMYTPDIISYYYKESGLNVIPEDSLVFFATCDSIKDYSLAKAFVDDAGADSFIGWSGHVLEWPNVIISHIVFFLLYKGWTVEKICDVIEYGWHPIHMLFQIKLGFYGNGNWNIEP